MRARGGPTCAADELVHLALAPHLAVLSRAPSVPRLSLSLPPYQQ